LRRTFSEVGDFVEGEDAASFFEGSLGRFEKPKTRGGDDGLASDDLT
jgi:hypothetical protein